MKMIERNAQGISNVIYFMKICLILSIIRLIIVFVSLFLYPYSMENYGHYNERTLLELIYLNDFSKVKIV